ncbi:molybdate ABC transporter substrate-binding protein [Candidatus Albibeggiatoa sp. nov. BB20]|uniref:molybdate ABC transporter substrate-binding protein n=1 Tax=Candidatus Albibeggiatoa sp. nov. BB20 TaxID=3162723 RepID=UPI003365897A
MKLMLYYQLCVFSLSLFITSNLSAAEITVAVAANFSKTIEEIGQAFAKDTEHTARFSFGPTGKLFAQISNGAPFDLFFAANEKIPKAAIDKGLTVKDSYFVYAQGALALYSASLPVATQKQAVLTQSKYRFIAIANPKTAPYGTQAVNYLKNKGLYDIVKSKLVNGESIAHAFQYVITGNAQLGFVALSHLVDPDSPAQNKGEYWIIPQSDYEPINQAAVMLKRGVNNLAAQAFIDYIKSDKTIEIIEKYGYSIPE